MRRARQLELEAWERWNRLTPVVARRPQGVTRAARAAERLQVAMDALVAANVKRRAERERRDDGEEEDCDESGATG